MLINPLGELVPCYVSEMPGEKNKALLIGFGENTWTARGTGPGYRPYSEYRSCPCAVVMFESGDIRIVSANAVTVDGAADIFRQYAWLDGDE